MVFCWWNLRRCFGTSALGLDQGRETGLMEQMDSILDILDDTDNLKTLRPPPNTSQKLSETAYQDQADWNCHCMYSLDQLVSAFSIYSQPRACTYIDTYKLDIPRTSCMDGCPLVERKSSNMLLLYHG